MVEQEAVNFEVASSSLASGANKKSLTFVGLFCYFWARPKPCAEVHFEHGCSRALYGLPNRV